jgi:hypothetical protein
MEATCHSAPLRKASPILRVTSATVPGHETLSPTLKVHDRRRNKGLGYLAPCTQCEKDSLLCACVFSRGYVRPRPNVGDLVVHSYDQMQSTIRANGLHKSAPVKTVQ